MSHAAAILLAEAMRQRRPAPAPGIDGETADADQADE
jgi:hypothetical protein